MIKVPNIISTKKKPTGIYELIDNKNKKMKLQFSLMYMEHYLKFKSSIYFYLLRYIYKIFICQVHSNIPSWRRLLLIEFIIMSTDTFHKIYRGFIWTGNTGHLTPSWCNWVSLQFLSAALWKFNISFSLPLAEPNFINISFLLPYNYLRYFSSISGSLF